MRLVVGRAKDFWLKDLRWMRTMMIATMKVGLLACYGRQKRLLARETALLGQQAPLAVALEETGIFEVGIDRKEVR